MLLSSSCDFSNPQTLTDGLVSTIQYQHQDCSYISSSSSSTGLSTIDSLHLSYGVQILLVIAFILFLDFIRRVIPSK